MGYFSDLDLRIRTALGYMPAVGDCKKCGAPLNILDFDRVQLLVSCDEQSCCNHQPHWIPIPQRPGMTPQARFDH